MSKYLVYGHFKDAKCHYVGCGTDKRPWDFFRRNENWKKIFNNEDPLVVIFNSFENRDRAIKFEKDLINHYVDQGYSLANKPTAKYWLGKKRDPRTMKKANLASRSPEAKEKRAAKRRGAILPDQWRQNISEGLKKSPKMKQHWESIKGQRLTAEHIEKLRRNTGWNHTDEAKEKMRQAALGRKMSDATKRKIRATKLANGNRTSKAKQVKCIELNKIYRSAKEAALDVSGSDKHIQACCVGRRMKHKNYHWEYA